MTTYMFIRFTASAFRKLPSVYVFCYFPFGFECKMWDLIVSVPDHCLSFYFGQNKQAHSICILSLLTNLSVVVACYSMLNGLVYFINIKYICICDIRH